jgi:hypothetical protein
MDRRLATLAAACDHNAPFALMYLRVTEGVSTAPGDERGGDAVRPEVRFRDPAYLNHLDAVFATLYFDAIDAWRLGDREAVPEAWRIAFEAAAERRVSGLGDILLGMNAHISRDLPFALERSGLRTADGRSGKADFDRVNSLLGDVQEPMLREQSRRFDPGIADTTLPALDIGAPSFAELMTRWRTEAFANGRRLIEAPPSERDAVAAEIESAGAGRARLIEALTSNLVLGPGADERREYCEERLTG